MNPEISRYIRRLQITKGPTQWHVTPPNRKMRLSNLTIDLGENHPFKKPENISPLVWSYQLFARALCQMDNLKALEWSCKTTPVLDANSDIGKACANQRILKQVLHSSNSMHPLTDSSYISIFDTPLSIPFLAPNYLPHLQAIDGHKDSVQSVVLSPCIPPRPMKKIIGFPTDNEHWVYSDLFKNICQSSLRIAVIPVKSIPQLTTFATLFPNVECIDIRRSDLVLENIGNTLNVTEEILCGLSHFKKLRIILGILLWEHDRREEIREDSEFFRWVRTLLPHLEFCGAEWQDGTVFTREDNNVDDWHWVRLPPAPFHGFLGREQDFTIREECDRFAA
ncbi:hypothetical protein Clacol_004371 [Clathrus columnatus]|uniref:Uncharacterized protein n=1 Tax=Clathrus columnatus TaxID=1419009 RepID=A0AAV5AB55_9AGAM|nr:hypothetical protein Clacol_004371 [Clathrus columnatus]